MDSTQKKSLISHCYGIIRWLRPSTFGRDLRLPSILLKNICIPPGIVDCSCDIAQSQPFSERIVIAMWCKWIGQHFCPTRKIDIDFSSCIITISVVFLNRLVRKSVFFWSGLPILYMFRYCVCRFAFVLNIKYFWYCLFLFLASLCICCIEFLWHIYSILYFQNLWANSESLILS